jgi:hypothetical protein
VKRDIEASKLETVDLKEVPEEKKEETRIKTPEELDLGAPPELPQEKEEKPKKKKVKKVIFPYLSDCY